MEFKTKYFEKEKWTEKAAFHTAQDAIIYAKDISARWPGTMAAVYEGSKKLFSFLNGKRYKN